jgi:hypothetical protein
MGQNIMPEKMSAVVKMILYIRELAGMSNFRIKAGEGNSSPFIPLSNTFLRKFKNSLKLAGFKLFPYLLCL